MPVRVVLVDDAHAGPRGLRQELSAREDIDVVAEAGDGTAAVDTCRVFQPDVVVLDLGVAELAGHDVLAGIRSACPQARLVVCRPPHAPAPSRASQDRREADEPGASYLAGLLAGDAGASDRAATMVLPGGPSDVAVARRLLAEHCDRWGCSELAEDAALVVSELVSNAVVHARTGCTLTLRHRPLVLRIEVEDRGTGMPDVRVTTAGDEHGRGLLLVSALSTAWGSEPTASGGKRVWAELSASQAGTLAGGESAADLQAG